MTGALGKVLELQLSTKFKVMPRGNEKIPGEVNSIFNEQFP